MTEKEKVYQEIQIRIKERARLNDEISKLWGKYYSFHDHPHGLTKSKKDE